MATFIPNVTDIFPEPSLFTPDFSFMDKMLQRRKAMYDQGFSQVNSAYNYVNRETTNPYNTKVKDQFLRQAKDNLKNLSAMDLSQFQNVEAANSVFTPFYNNKDVIGDQTLTDHWNRQVSLGNSFRTKDGGKEFSQTNIDYILQQKNWFAQDTPDTWSEYWATKRSYSPYYDASKEIQEAMKNFKPDHTKVVNIDGFYIKTVDDKSWYEGQIQQYLNSVLSDKAKNQWRIEGAVKYGNDPALLASMYTQSSTAVAPKVQDEIDDLEIQMRNEKDPAKLAELTKKRDGFIEQQQSINDNLSSIQSGDLKMLRRNSESLAYDIYYREKIADIAKGYSHQDIEQDIKFNDIAKMFWENDQKWAMERWKRDNEVEDRDLKYQREKEFKLMDANSKAKEGQLPLLLESGNTVPFSTTKQGIKNQIELLTNDAVAAQTELAKHIKVVMKMDPSHAVTGKEFNAFIKSHPNDEKVFAYVDKKNAVQASIDDFSNFSKNANTYAAEQLGQTKWKAYTNLTRVKSKRALTAQEQVAYNALNVAYNKLVNNYEDPKFRLQGVSTFGYGLNPADKRFAAAAGSIQNYTGLDKSAIGAISYIPNRDNTIDMKFTVQQDPTKTTWSKTEAVKLLETKLAGTGATYTWDDDNVVTIKNAKGPIKDLDQYDPYSGIPNTTRIALLRMANYSAPGGVAQFNIPMRSRGGKNLLFRVAKSGDNNYYLMSNKGNILSDGNGSTYSSAEEVGQNIKTLVNNFSDAQLINLLNR